MKTNCFPPSSQSTIKGIEGDQVGKYGRLVVMPEGERHNELFPDVAAEVIEELGGDIPTFMANFHGVLSWFLFVHLMRPSLKDTGSLDCAP